MVKRKAGSSDLEKFWRAAVARQNASGLSISEFCRRENLEEHKYHYWVRAIKGRDRTEKAELKCANASKRARKEEEFWLVILESWQQSGQSLRQFADSRMISYRDICRWRKRLLPESDVERTPPCIEKQDESVPEFVPARLVDTQEEVIADRSSEEAPSVVEIVLRCGRLIRVSSACSPSFLKTIIIAVEDC